MLEIWFPDNIQHVSNLKSISSLSAKNQGMEKSNTGQTMTDNTRTSVTRNDEGTENSIAGDTALIGSGTSSPDARRYYIFPKLTSTVPEQTAFANMLQALGTTVKYSTIMDGNGTGKFMMWMITLTTEQATKLKGDKMVSGFC